LQNLVSTLAATGMCRIFFNLPRMFVLLISGSSLNMSGLR